MTLTIHTEEDTQRQLKVKVEVPEERVQRQMERTAREIARGVNIPGFRRGKVPYKVILQRVGREALRSEAVEELLTPVFEETLTELDVAPYAQPSLDEMQMEPLVIEFTVPMEPTVALGDYRAFRAEKDEAEVTDEDVEEALEHVRSHHEVLEPVDREVMEGDVVAISGTGEIVTEDAVNVIFDEERVELLMDPETTFAGTEFVKNMLGMEVGDEGEFTITFPEDVDDEDLAGKEATFNVTLLDVKSRYLPELDDELAKAEGDYETVEELRAALREQLEAQAQQRARNDLFDAMMDQMIAEADIVFPPAAIEEELDGMLESTREQATRAGWQWNDYLTLQGETEESLREAWREQAEERLERGLVLREFIRNEKLGLDEQEIDAAVEQRLEQYGEGAELQEQIRQFFRQGQGLEMLSTELVMEKVYDRVEQIAAGIAPDLESLATEAASSDEEE